MKNPLPLLLGAAALLLIGGKKKKTPTKPEQETGAEEVSEEGGTPSMVEYHQAPSLGGQDVPEYGIAAKGTRKDRRGLFPWQVYRDADGYHAQIMLDDSRFAPVQEEVGIANSTGSAKTLLKNRFNELLLEKYPSEKPKNDPAPARAI